MPAAVENVDATIVITTKNRKEELCRALNSCVIQSATVEILVMDDGSSDGTAEMVRSEFPEVRVERRETSKGLIVRRNEAAKLALGSMIFSIDDDAVFSSPNTVRQTLAEFDHPRVAAVAIPFIDIRSGNMVLQRAPDRHQRHVTSTCVGTAHAFRRDIFLLQDGGYREFLFHQGEENDLCVRLLNKGYVIRLGSADPIHHFESLQRDMWRMDVYGRRNDVLYAWYNVPMPFYLFHTTANTFNGFFFGVKHGRLWRTFLGTMKGITGCIHEFNRRAPVSRAIYRLSRRLRKRSLLLEDIELLLPPLPATALGKLLQRAGPRVPEAGEAVPTGPIGNRAAVVITTKNRKDELRKAIRSALNQTIPVEVIVMDDGSSDGTEEMLRGEFPEVRFFSSFEPVGYIVLRNRAASLARSPVLFSLDDDAMFAAPDIVERTLADFSSPRVGAIAIPHIDVIRNDTVKYPAPADGVIYVTESFVGTAYAVRRDLFLRLGGYREVLVHQGEEGDYCIRMLNAGYVTRLGTASFIEHFESPKRDLHRMDFYGRRSDVLFAWHNVPMPFFPVHLLVNTMKGLWFSLRLRRPVSMTYGALNGYFSCLTHWSARAPVRKRTYRLHRRLRKRGTLKLDTLEMYLPPIVDAFSIMPRTVEEIKAGPIVRGGQYFRSTEPGEPSSSH